MTIKTTPSHCHQLRQLCLALNGHTTGHTQEETNSQWPLIKFLQKLSKHFLTAPAIHRAVKSLSLFGRSHCTNRASTNEPSELLTLKTSFLCPKAYFTPSPVTSYTPYRVEPARLSRIKRQRPTYGQDQARLNANWSPLILRVRETDHWPTVAALP